MRDLLTYPDNSRVWIYQSNTELPADEIGVINHTISEFANRWVSHNRQLRATGGLIHDRFLVLVADESQAGASGCSIDSSVRFVRQLGSEYQVDFFDRLQFAYLEGQTVKVIHKDRLKEAWNSGEIDDDTLFFDNLVNTKAAFIRRWLVPLGQSWIKRFV